VLHLFTDGWRYRKDPPLRGDLSELSHRSIACRAIFPSHSHLTVRQNLLDLPRIRAWFSPFIEITNNIPALQTEHRNLSTAPLKLPHQHVRFGSRVDGALARTF